jgi:hypothetical protein
MFFFVDSCEFVFKNDLPAGENEGTNNTVTASESRSRSRWHYGWLVV